MNEEKNLEEKVEDLEDSIVSYDRLGHQAYKIETSEWVEVSKDGNSYSVLVLRDTSGKGLCPAISCGGYLKCGSTYSRVEDLRKHLIAVHYFKPDDVNTLKLTSKKPKSKAERAEDNLARKKIKKLHSLGLSSEEAEDIRHDSKC